MPNPVKWILGVFVLIGVPLCVLTYGNPQWGKYVYMWQSYVLDRNLEVLNNYYTGTWTVWDKDGTKLHATEWLNGVRDGTHRSWYTNGQVYEEIDYANGQRHGEHKQYWRKGGLIFSKQYKLGACVKNSLASNEAVAMITILKSKG